MRKRNYSNAELALAAIAAFALTVAIGSAYKLLMMWGG
jgi:hypothetical protein